MMLKKNLLLVAFLVLYCFGNNAFAQKAVFNLQYNAATQLYEVYGKADFSDERFFVGGGSQLSIILPTGLLDYPLDIQSVAGGPWMDNSQVYTPAVDAAHDYHGIATNGSVMNFKEGVETLLFTFKLPATANEKEVRLFDNQKDPHSNKVGMAGADFCNFFACALTVKNVYNGLYSEDNSVNLTVENEATPLAPSLETALLSDFDLHQNQPNPFKNVTFIEYVLPIASAVTFTFRDVTGRVVQEIKQDGQKGQNALQLNTKNLPRGLIHYQLDTPFGSKNKKMIVLE